VASCIHHCLVASGLLGALGPSTAATHILCLGYTTTGVLQQLLGSFNTSCHGEYNQAVQMRTVVPVADGGSMRLMGGAVLLYGCV
jgi:hypothetical protein